jgi:hypothetical protein
MVVAAELTKHVPKGSHAILIMPQLYRRYIETELRKASITFENPVEHLPIGKQIKWLSTKTHGQASGVMKRIEAEVEGRVTCY